MILAKMPNSEEMKSEETTYSRQTRSPVEEWGHQHTCQNLNRIIPVKECRDKKQDRDGRKSHPVTDPTWDPFNGWAQMSDTIIDTILCLQTGG